MGQRDFHTEDYSRGFHQAEETSFNVMIHTRPNLMKNVGCCYGNSIRWNFSLLASLWHYSFKRTSRKGTLQWGQRQSLGDDSAHPFFYRRECNSIMKPHQLAQRSGHKDVILRFLWNPQVSFSLTWFGNYQDDDQIFYVKNAGLSKKTMKTMSLQKIRICFVVLSCLIFKHKYATLKFHLNLSTDKKLNTKFEYLF